MASSGYAPGDVVSLEFPFSDGAGGKDRPALVVSGPSAHGDYTVAMISTSQQGDGVAIAPADFATGKLNADSFVRISHLFTCESSTFVIKRGALKPATMKRVLAALCPALGCKS